MEIDRRTFLASSLSAVALACAGRSAGGGGAPRASARKLLVLGGTGFLGPAIVEAARSRGHVLTLFNRGRTNPGLFPDVETLHGDRDGKLDALRERSWDAAIDTSGYVPRVVSMSARLLAPAVRRYLFVSTISVYADGMPPGSDETAPLATMPDPASEEVREHYGALKAMCERSVEESLPGRALVVRPGLIVGPRDPTDRFTYWPVRVARGGEVLAPGDGKDPVQIVDVRDLAAFLVALVERDETGTYNAAGPERTLTLAALLDACRVAAPGSDAAFTWIPAPFLEKAGVSPWSDLPAWIPAGPDAGILQVSNARAIAKGLRFRPVVETARDTLAWWRALPEDRRATPKAGLSPEREREVLARWHAERRAAR